MKFALFHLVLIIGGLLAFLGMSAEYGWKTALWCFILINGVNSVEKLLRHYSQTIGENMHSTKVTVIADQIVKFKDEEINIHHIQTIVIDEDFKVVEVIKKREATIRIEEYALVEKLKDNR